MNLYNYVVLEIAHEEDRRPPAAGPPSRTRNLNTREDNDSFLLSDREFISRYRLKKTSVRELIEDVRPNIPEQLRADSFDLETKMLTALRFYASGSYQQCVADTKHLSMCQASVSNCLDEITEALNQEALFTKYIKFPATREERERVKRGFYANHRMPGVVGCIDGTHVAIIRPSADDHEEQFYNRKGYHSLNVLLVCDSELNILCIDPSYPGSTHDSTVWRNNSLNENLARVRAATQEEIYLLGDSGYPLRPTIMTPILNAEPDTPEALYTEMHVSTRNCVERCIGVLKARFRCLLAARQLHYRPLKAAKIVNACALLHNIAHRTQTPFTPLTREEWERELALTRQASPQANAGAIARESDLQQGQAVRQRLVQRVWQNRIV